MLSKVHSRILQQHQYKTNLTSQCVSVKFVQIHKLNCQGVREMKTLPAVYNSHTVNSKQIHSLSSKITTAPVKNMSCLISTKECSLHPSKKSTNSYFFNSSIRLSPIILPKRHASDGPPTPAPTTEPEKLKGWAKLKYTVQRFMNGSKVLVGDMRLARQYKKKGKDTQLTREEVWHIKQTQKDFRKTLPFLILFWIPSIGYSAPVLGFMFPKQLLSQQFWDDQQKTQYMLEDHNKRLKHYREVIDIVTNAKDGDDKTKLDKINDEDIAKLRDAFNTGFTLNDLSKNHIVSLCGCWDVPTVNGLLPKSLLAYRLAWSVREVIDDDKLVRRDGVDTLSDRSLVMASYSRLNGSTSASDSKKFLANWIGAVGDVSDSDVSFVAHAAVIKSFNKK